MGRHTSHLGRGRATLPLAVCLLAPRCTSRLKRAVRGCPPTSTQHFTLLLCPRRGYKTVLRFFPNDVACFEPVVGLLVTADVAQRQLEAGAALRLDDGAGLWEALVGGAGVAAGGYASKGCGVQCTSEHQRIGCEARVQRSEQSGSTLGRRPASPSSFLPCAPQYILLLWLSMLVLIPFDIATVDSSLAAGAASLSLSAANGGDAAAAAAPGTGAGSSCGGSGGPAEGAPLALPPACPPIVGTIVGLCARHLASPGSTREMAAVVLGRLLTRPDMAPALAAFLDWGCAALGSSDSQRASFLVPGGCTFASRGRWGTQAEGCRGCRSGH